MLALLEEIEKASKGKLQICRNMADVDKARTQNNVAAIFHIEGADCIHPDLTALDMLYDRGLRSIGLVWSRNNIFGNGAPFQFPGSPDIGSGLTDAGKALVTECNQRKILVDLSHLNEKGFWDVAEISTAPLVATHSNAHQLCQSPRNLTDQQIKAIGKSGGVIGINFAPCFIAADGMLTGAVPIEALLQHLNHIVHLAGIGSVALGSDFDGVMMPDEIGDVTGVGNIFDALDRAGMTAEFIEKVAIENWMRVLSDTLG
jgi:membrane dipeptidase